MTRMYQTLANALICLAVPAPSWIWVNLDVAR